jgi:hypothetical protein
MARSISDRPRGKEPVLFSRRLNSVVFIAASIAVDVKPSFSSRSSWVRISASTCRSACMLFVRILLKTPPGTS